MQPTLLLNLNTSSFHASPLWKNKFQRGRRKKGRKKVSKLTKALPESFERSANRQHVLVKMLPPFSEILSPDFSLYI